MLRTDIPVPAWCAQADLDLLASACHGDDVVSWAGAGLPDHLGVAGAPANATVTPLVAFRLMQNGTAAVPVNLVRIIWT